MSEYPPAPNSDSYPSVPPPVPPMDGDATITDAPTYAPSSPPPLPSEGAKLGDETITDAPTWAGPDQSAQVPSYESHSDVGDATVAEAPVYRSESVPPPLPPTDGDATIADIPPGNPVTQYPAYGTSNNAGDATLAENPIAHQPLDSFTSGNVVRAGDVTVAEGTILPSQDATVADLPGPEPAFGWSQSANSAPGAPAIPIGDATEADAPTVAPVWTPGPIQQPPFGAPPMAGQPMEHRPPTMSENLIPTKNTPALLGYYAGVFSLIPCLGLFCGLAGLILGIMGLKAIKRDPNLPGKVHAWIGIVLGGGMFLLQSGFAIFILTVVSQSQPR